MTSNYVSRNGEFRADEHSARMGMGAEMESAFHQMEADQGQYEMHNAKVLHLLDKSGLKFDADAIRDIAESVKEAISEASNPLPPTTKNGLDPLAPQEFISLPNPLKVTKKVLGKVGETLEKTQDNIFVAQVDNLNSKFKNASAYIERSSQPAQATESAPEPEGWAKKINKALNTLEEAQRTHPKHKDRIERVKKVEPCKGCADPSPFASHGDRVKAISDSGIQGFTPSR